MFKQDIQLVEGSYLVPIVHVEQFVSGSKLVLIHVEQFRSISNPEKQVVQLVAGSWLVCTQVEQSVVLSRL